MKSIIKREENIFNLSIFALNNYKISHRFVDSGISKIRRFHFCKMPEVLTLSSMADTEPDLSTFENKSGLAEDMKFLASMPELCDVTFLVGDTREPVCAVKVCVIFFYIRSTLRIKIMFFFCKAVLAARSRVFQKMLYQAPSPQRKKEPPPRENKLRLFLKRSSEPLLNLQNAAQQVFFLANFYYLLCGKNLAIKKRNIFCFEIPYIENPNCIDEIV